MRIAGRGGKVVATTRKNSRAFPTQVNVVDTVDLTDAQAVERVADTVKHQFDKPFCWLHCAGDFWHHKVLEDTALDDAKNLIDSHYLTLYATAQQIVPIMKQYGGGRILAFSCNSVRYNYPEMTGFTPAKAAVESFIKCLANEVMKFDVFANCLALPTIGTETVRRFKHSDYHSHYASVDDLVDVVEEAFFSMSPLITGNVISVVKHSPFFYEEGYYKRNRSK